MLGPLGTEDGVAPCLFADDGRYVGMLNVSTRRPRHTPDPARAVVTLLTEALAATPDHRSVPPSGKAAAADARRPGRSPGNRTHPLARTRQHETRTAGVPQPLGLPKESAEHVKSILALQLPQADVEFDLIVGMETEDRQHTGSRPDPRDRALGIRRGGTARPPSGAPEAPSVSPSEYWRFQPPLHDRIEDRPPVLHRGIRDTRPAAAPRALVEGSAGAGARSSASTAGRALPPGSDLEFRGLRAPPCVTGRRGRCPARSRRSPRRSVPRAV
ncbi:hypothetical protein GCM10010266_59810 [Streptomyces griseomycini]|nr:hypothetical protein GCM10010266_59810 [Streptomyces griseomycini]